MKPYNKISEFITDAIVWSFLYFGALVTVPGLPFRYELVLAGLIAVFLAFASILKVSQHFKSVTK